MSMEGVLLNAAASAFRASATATGTLARTMVLFGVAMRSAV
jgi:hypothetical protein